MFSTPSPLRGTPSKPEGELQLLRILKKIRICFIRIIRAKKWSTQLCVTEILPPFGRLDDKMVMIVLIE